MVRKDFDEGRKPKPRGRPFEKGHKGKPGKQISDSPGHKSSVERGVIAPTSQSAHEEPENKPAGLQNLHTLVTETIDNTLKETMNSPQVEEMTKEKKPEELELIETIDFKNGENTLSIRLSKKHNRMFRIQVFLNDESEIRPVTYTGASTGYSFWNLLKGALKK